MGFTLGCTLKDNARAIFGGKFPNLPQGLVRVAKGFTLEFMLTPFLCQKERPSLVYKGRGL